MAGFPEALTNSDAFGTGAIAGVGDGDAVAAALFPCKAAGTCCDKIVTVHSAEASSSSERALTVASPVMLFRTRTTTLTG